ncbi:hypothetical protein D3C79_869720 [compost metagenome]
MGIVDCAGRLRYIEGHCTQVAQVLAKPQVGRAVEFAGHQAAVNSGVPVGAYGQRALPEQRGLEGAGGVVAPDRGTVTPYAWAQQIAHGRVRLDEAADLAIGLGHDDFQLAAACGTQVVDGVGAGADVRRVDRITMLPDLDFRPALGHAANDRGITALVVGQHAHVRGHAYA